MKQAIYFIYFGKGKFLPLLRRIWSQHLASGTSLPAFVLTDQITSVPPAMPTVRVDPYVYARRFTRANNDGWAFDYKSCLIMSLIDKGVPRPVVLDCDNEIRRPFDDIVAQCDPSTFYISPDPGGRIIRHPAFRENVVEQSSSCMVFPEDAASVCRLYRELWVQSSEPSALLLEQRTWTLCYHATAGKLLPKTMAWSRLWGDEPADVRIRHPHGSEKWEVLR